MVTPMHGSKYLKSSLAVPRCDLLLTLEISQQLVGKIENSPGCSPYLWKWILFVSFNVLVFGYINVINQHISHNNVKKIYVILGYIGEKVNWFSFNISDRNLIMTTKLEISMSSYNLQVGRYIMIHLIQLQQKNKKVYSFPIFMHKVKLWPPTNHHNNISSIHKWSFWAGKCMHQSWRFKFVQKG